MTTTTRRWVRLTALVSLWSLANTKTSLNPYTTLGVSQTASIGEIKRAYLLKTYGPEPPSVEGLSPEEAVDVLKELSQAFEVLSDMNSRAEYDKTGSVESFFSYNNEVEKLRKKKKKVTSRFKHVLQNRLEVRQAQSRTLHVKSLNQFMTVALDDRGRLERNAIVAFCTPGETQRILEDDIMFPYPYSGKHADFGLWWEEMVQPIQVVYSEANELTDLFDMPDLVHEKLKSPRFVFLRRGQTLYNHAEHFRTKNKDEFEHWVMDMLDRIEITVSFRNVHSSAVELFYLEGNYHERMATIKPGRAKVLKTKIFSEFAARDYKVDRFPQSPGRDQLTLESVLKSWVIDWDVEPIELLIETPPCYDLSGYCGEWAAQAKCQGDVAFMTNACAETCNFCSRNSEEKEEEEEL